MAKVTDLKFHNAVVITKVAGPGNIFVLKEPFEVSFRTQFAKVPTRLRVAAGFLTDGASVPRLLWWFAPPLAGEYFAAAVLHDAMYASHIVSKDTADWMFLRGMLLAGVNGFKARLMYRAVRMFGNGPWKKGGDMRDIVTFVED